MLGAERAAEAENRARGRLDRRTTARLPAGQLTATTAVEAVNATERMLCGDGAVHSPTVAEGLALTGRPAATLLDRDATGSPVDGPSTAVAWVHHRIGTPHQSVGSPVAFELIAGDAQEAVDHCLVARRLAAELGLPGVCTLDAETANALGLVRLPCAETAGAIRDAARVDATRSERRKTPSSAAVVDQAAEAFEAVALRTGRDGAIVFTHGLGAARLALIAEGAQRRHALALAEALSAAGAPCGVVGITLVRPFPAERVRDALSGIPVVVVVEPPGGSDLAARVRGAVGVDRQGQVNRMEIEGDGAVRLPAEVVETLDLPPQVDLQLEPAAGKAFAFGFAPAGPFAERLLLDVAGLVGRVGQVELERPATSPANVSSLVLGRGADRGAEGNRLELLFVAHPSSPGSFEGQEEIDALGDGATLVLCSADHSPETMWSSLGARRRSAIKQRGLRTMWLPTSALVGAAADTYRASSWVLGGAMIAASRGLAAVVDERDDLVEALCHAQPGSSPSPEETELLRRGARALQRLDLEALDKAVEKQESDFRDPLGLPTEPAAPSEQPPPAWPQSLRHFHLTGEGATSAADPLPAGPLRPAILDAMSASCEAWRQFPVVLPGDDATPRIVPLSDVVTRAFERLATDGAPASILQQHESTLVRMADRVLGERGKPAPMGEVMQAALERVVDGLDVSPAGADQLSQQTERLKAALPSSGSVLGLAEGSMLQLFVATLRRERHPKKQAFREELEQLADRLSGLLRLDDSHSEQGRSPEVLSASLAAGTEFLDPAALSRHLPEHHGSKRMDPRRRNRVENALACLRARLEALAGEPDLILVRTAASERSEDPEGCRVLRHAEGLEAAIGIFDGLADGMVDTIRAVRTARLEVDRRYDPELHDKIIARTGWQSFTAEELLLLPAVVVLESGRRLRGKSLAPFSKLLRSGRPVHVLVAESTADLQAGETWEALAGYHPGLGYLAVAHREPFVVQSTLARPGHLVAGFERMANVPRPAVAIVGVPNWEASVPPWLQLVGAHQSRTTPCLRYDPIAGETWAERFDLEENPQSDAAWPAYEVSFLDSSGNRHSREESFTFAHAAATDPAYRPHFRLIPREAWGDDQAEIAAYLAMPERERRSHVPYIWVVDERSELARAVMTRELAFACRDRARAWRILQELAGTHNEHARRAADRAREEARAEAEAERRALQAAHAAELERVRAEAAGQAMERLAAVLMDLDSIPAPPAAPAAVTEAAPVIETVPQEAEAVEEVEEEEEEEEISFDEPYIDSVLCTTCNECTNLNARMFQYNENRQAFIADANAGTFEQLVKAAEKCPARCIHPGVPRSDDDTVTDELVNRAKPFN